MFSANLVSGFSAMFRQKLNVIGMVHVGGFPGSTDPKKWAKVLQWAQHDSRILKRNQLDGMLIENLYDTPYRKPKDLTPEVIACMTSIGIYVRKSLNLKIPCGIQILAGCNLEALAAAHASSCQFIRAEGLVYAHIADEGFMDACAGALMRYKKQLNSTALIFADIKKKYCSHAITGDIDITEVVHAAELAKVDAIVLTGNRSGDPVNLDEFHRVRQCTKLPVIIGSGVTVENVADYSEAEGVIVGSHFKEDGDIMKPVCPERVEAFMRKVADLRGDEEHVPLPSKRPRRRSASANAEDIEVNFDAAKLDDIDIDFDDDRDAQKKGEHGESADSSKVERG